MPPPGRRSGWSIGRPPCVEVEGELRGWRSRQGQRWTGPMVNLSRRSPLLYMPSLARDLPPPESPARSRARGRMPCCKQSPRRQVYPLPLGPRLTPWGMWDALQPARAPRSASAGPSRRTRSCVWTAPEKCGAIRTLDIYWLAGGHRTVAATHEEFDLRRWWGEARAALLRRRQAGDDAPVLLLREGAAGLDADVAPGAEGERPLDRRLIVRRLGHDHPVV